MATSKTDDIDMNIFEQTISGYRISIWNRNHKTREKHCKDLQFHKPNLLGEELLFSVDDPENRQQNNQTKETIRMDL